VLVAAAGRSAWFDAVRRVGAVYLVYLGGCLPGRLRHQHEEARINEPAAGSSGGCCAHGLLISLSNSEVILFLGAFLPQFVDAGADPLPQLAVLAVLCIAVLAFVDVATTFAVARVRTLASAKLRLLDGVSGAFLTSAGRALAAMRRP
jgi:threonine/homoserine/homoserine lactone efflux protein